MGEGHASHDAATCVAEDCEDKEERFLPSATTLVKKIGQLESSIFEKRKAFNEDPQALVDGVWRDVAIAQFDPEE